MTTLAGGQFIAVSVPAGSAIDILGGSGTASELSDRALPNKTLTFTGALLKLGPFSSAHTVNLTADAGQTVTYYVYADPIPAPSPETWLPIGLRPDGTTTAGGPGGAPVSLGGAGATTAASTSRSLAAGDSGKTLECTTTLSLTLPAGLGTSFGVALIVDAGVTVSIVSSGGVLLNGATTTITRTSTANTMFAVVSKATADSYAVTGT